jgi:hypothetical protein
MMEVRVERVAADEIRIGRNPTVRIAFVRWVAPLTADANADGTYSAFDKNR